MTAFDADHSFAVMMRQTNIQQVAIGFLFLCAGAAIRFHHLDGQSLWNDEMFSMDVGKLAFTEIQPQLIAHYHHPPLFFYLLHFVFAAMGQSAWSLRLISALSGSLTIGIVFYVAASLFGNRAGVVAGVISLFSPFHLAYSQEGRPYALAALLALLSCMFFVRLLQERTRSRMFFYCVATIALLYTHHWGIFVAFAQFLYALVVARSDHTLKKYVIGMAIVIGFSYVPELYALYRQSAGHGSDSWFWAESPSAFEVVRVAEAFSGSYFKMASSIFDSPAAVRILGALAIGASCLMAIDAAFRHRQNIALQGFLFCCCAGLMIPFGLSFVKPEIFLWYRYTIIIYPVVCVLIGAMAMLGRWKAIALGSVAVLMAVSAYGTVRYFSWSKSNARDVARYVQEVGRDTVKILIRPAYVAPLLNYYYSGVAVQLDEAYLNTTLGEIVDTAHSFIYISLDAPNEIRQYMDGHFEKVAEKEFPGEAHMGMIVGFYRQRPEPDDSSSSGVEEQ